MPELSIIICTTLDREEIDCIEPIKDDEFEDYEIIIRRDDGLAKARNTGVLQASADKLVFLDDDSIPMPGYLQTVSELLNKYPAVAGRVVDPRDHFLARMGEIRGYDKGELPKVTTSPIGCNMAFRREVFDAGYKFDENIDFGHEEKIFAEEISDEFPIQYRPELVVKHEFGNTVSKWLSKQLEYGHADVYKSRKLNEPVFHNLADFVPIRFGKTIQETAIISTGKAIRNISRLKAIIFGVPNHEN